MGKLYEEIDGKLADWIGRQRLFFVATAPARAATSTSRRRARSARCGSSTGSTVEYDDHVGSGAETAAHVRENGRICLMLCAFEGPPRIVRLHGRGEVFRPRIPASGVRGVIRVHVERISDSCGYGVPLMEFVAERPAAGAVARAEGRRPASATTCSEKNAASIDGLPAFTD